MVQVGSERRKWANGELLLFDTSVLHAAANEAAKDRYVLMMRVWHPELAPVEIDALEHIFACLDEPEKVLGGGRAPTGASPPAEMSRAERRRLERAEKKKNKKARR